MKALPVPAEGILLVRKLKPEEPKTESGIVMPSAVADSDVGEVVAAGEPRTMNDANGRPYKAAVQVHVKAGDKIIIPRVPHVIVWNGEELLVIPAENVYAVLSWADDIAKVPT